MMKPIPLSIIGLLAVTSSLLSADWPQWRGPDRNGVVRDSPVLPSELTEATAPQKVWELEGIPSDHYGGHGSLAVANGRVYLALVWHRDEPTDVRKIDRRVTSALGSRATHSIPPEIVEKMEHDRMNLSRRLRGAALDQYAREWVEQNLEPKAQLSLGNWVVSRFRKGKSAVPLSVFETLSGVSDRTFGSQEEMEAWVNQQDFDPAIKNLIIEAVPDTRLVANDVILVSDSATGKEIWRFEKPGLPTGRGSSSTPAVVDGKIYAALSEHLYCLDAETGKEVWQAELKGKKGPASSPLICDGKVILQENFLCAFDAESGDVIWKNEQVKGSNQSPAIWKNVVLCNSAKEFKGVDLKNGTTLWTVPGGGDGTPVVSGDVVVVSSRSEGKNLIAYRLSDQGPKQLWSRGFLSLRYGSSPIIYDGNVYYLGSQRHCCINLESGKMQWERQASSSISSPILADGKLLVYENRGGFLAMLQATPDDYTNLGRAKVGALRCASPALVGKDLFLRTKKSVVCYRFR